MPPVFRASVKALATGYQITQYILQGGSNPSNLLKAFLLRFHYTALSMKTPEYFLLT